MMNGNIHSYVDLDFLKEYKYNEIVPIFEHIEENKYYNVLHGTEIIYTNLYNIKLSHDLIILDQDLTIIFLPYTISDVDKIKCEYSKYSLFGNNICYNYQLKTAFDFKSDFNLEQENLENDELFMKFCVNLNSCLLKYASDELKNNFNIVVNAFVKNNNSFQYASNEMKNNKNHIMTLINKCKYPLNVCYVFSHISDKLKNDIDIVRLVLKNDIYQYRFIGDELKKSEQLIIELFNHEQFTCNIIKYFDPVFRNDKNMIIKCMDAEKKVNQKINGVLKQTYGLNANIEISLTIDCLGDQLLNDHELISKCIEHNGLQIFNVPTTYKINRNAIIIALKSNNSSMDVEYDKFLCKFSQYKNDKEIVLLAIKKYGHNFYYASQELKNNIDVVKEAIKYCYWDYENIGYSSIREASVILQFIKNIHDKIENILRNTNVPKKLVLDAILDKIERQYKFTDF